MNSAFTSEDSQSSVRENSLKDPLALLTSIGLALGVAGISGMATLGIVDGWYAAATTTIWTPPNVVFGPVWLVLYSLMAIAAWLVWRSPASRDRTLAMRLYGGQLAMNAAWTPLFFLGYDFVGPVALWSALAWIVVLGFVVLSLLVVSWRVSKLGAALFVPYWGWLLFATALNASLAVMNS